MLEAVAISTETHAELLRIHAQIATVEAKRNTPAMAASTETSRKLLWVQRWTISLIPMLRRIPRMSPPMGTRLQNNRPSNKCIELSWRRGCGGIHFLVIFRLTALRQKPSRSNQYYLQPQRTQDAPFAAPRCAGPTDFERK